MDSAKNKLYIRKELSKSRENTMWYLHASGRCETHCEIREHAKENWNSWVCRREEEKYNGNSERNGIGNPSTDFCFHASSASCSSVIVFFLLAVFFLSLYAFVLCLLRFYRCCCRDNDNEHLNRRTNVSRENRAERKANDSSVVQNIEIDALRRPDL